MKGVGGPRRAHSVSRDLMRRALALELAHNTLSTSAASLATPGELIRTLRQMSRGMGRDDCLLMLGHMAMMVRLFADEVPTARRDQMLAALDDFDAGLRQDMAPGGQR